MPAFLIAMRRVPRPRRDRARHGRPVPRPPPSSTRSNEIYWITPLDLLPLVLLAYLSIRKVPASLALLASALFAGVLGAFLQPDVYADFVAGTRQRRCVESIKAVWLAMANGFSIDSGIADVDRLLSRGGMDSMLLTIWLIIGAVTFGAMLEEFGLIDRLVDPMIAAAQSTGRLFLTVFACGFGLNVVAGDQYIALVLPSRIFRAEFARRGLAPTNLSRLAADSGTVTSPAGAVELLRRVHGRDPGRLHAALPAVRRLLLRQSRAERPVRDHRLQDREESNRTELAGGHGMSTQTEQAPASAVAKMSVPTLTAMVVGGMVGAGVFSLPARFGVATGILGSLIAWAIAGTGMLMLAFVFQNLAIRKPELDSGRLHLRQGRLRRLRRLQLRDRLLGQLGRRQHLLLGVHRARRSARSSTASATATRCWRSVLSTVGVWLFHYLIARGVRDAAVINRIVTVFKILPILVFIVVLFVNFDAGAIRWFCCLAHHAADAFIVVVQRPLVAVQVLHVVAVPRPAHGLIRIETGRALDLDHVGAEVGQDAGAGRPGAHAGEVEHTDVGQSGRGGRLRHETLAAFVSSRVHYSAASGRPLAARWLVAEAPFGMHGEGQRGAEQKERDRADERQRPVAGQVDDEAEHQRRHDRRDRRTEIHQAARRAGVLRRDVHRHRPDRPDHQLQAEEPGAQQKRDDGQVAAEEHAEQAGGSAKHRKCDDVPARLLQIARVLEDAVADARRRPCRRRRRRKTRRRRTAPSS